MPMQATPKDSLTVLIREARGFPVLTAETERELARRYRDHGDVAAMHELVGSHLRLVVKIAMGFRGYGLPVSDLVSQGNVGLMQAVKKFDPDRGFRLSTYAMWWIRAAIQEYILHSWSLVKLGTTAAQKKLFFNLRKVKSRIDALEDADLAPETVATIATRLNVPRQDVVNMNQRLMSPDHSLNSPAWDQDDGELQDWLVDDGEDQESALANAEESSRQSKLLAEALGMLNTRERNILIERRLKETRTTLGRLSRLHRISRERVRQIELRAFEKVQKTIRASNVGQHVTV